MSSHEYRVVPAPRRGLKAKGVRRPEERFARAVEAEMNRMAAEGWEFVRSDTLPCERKSGWFSRPVTVFETLLVFRRPAAETKAAMPPPVALTPPASVAAPAPAASRFTPFPGAPLPANATAAALHPPGPTLSIVSERTEPALAPEEKTEEVGAADSQSEPRRAAE